ncbi:MAG: helix-turn-helix domain-containing protein [Caldilineaceae bacterium]|nr:helix-turn-helix domain-containing protein [Caldilineaceae bacterium]
MSESIEAKELQLVSIFDDTYRFEVPEYQRPYAWTTEQTGELLDDILHAMGEVEEVHDAPPYFLGSIVIIKKGLRPQAQIVDGQQRIATLTILFCVLRELAAESDKSSIDRYVYEPGDKFAGIQGHYRLSVRGRDNSFFRDNIQERGKLSAAVKRPLNGLPDSQRGMVQNAGYMMEELAKLDERRRDTLMQFLVQRCYLVVVSTSDRNSAYRIFSVLNDRGLDLSPTDILKAEIIGSLPKDSRARNTAVWEEIEEDLGRDRFRDLFAHIRMISMKSRAQGTLQQEFQEHVLKEVDREAFIEKVLEPYAEAYVTVTGATCQRAGGSGEVNRYLRFLNRLDNFDWIPPAMAFFRRHDSSPDAIFGFVRDLERLAYKMFIMRENINRRIQRYRSVLHSIQRREDLSAARSPLQLDAGEKAELLRVLDGPIYTRRRVPRVLLLRLDTLLAEAGASYEHPIITIEHVLPQNPKRGSQWFRDFPDEEERTEWTHRLGNLVLLSRIKNSGASNYEFDYKKREYFQKGGAAAFVLTASVRDESEWTPEVLERRQRKLIDVLKKEWRLGEATSLQSRAVSGVEDVTTNSIYEQTRQLLQQGLPLEEVARQRGRSKSTIVVHLEHLLQERDDIDLRPLLPPDRFEKIRAAFRQTGGTHISPVKDILGDDYSYEESRVVHLYLQQEDRTKQGGQHTVTGRQGERAADLPAATPPGQGAAESEGEADSPAACRVRRKRAGRIGATHERTRQLWEQGLSIEEIAEKRGLAKTTIVGHLDRLIDDGVGIDLRPQLPPPERYALIRRAFEESGGTLMAPVKKLLGDAYDYDEIKMVWIHLRRQGELPE